jgi:hypothetical protein
MVDVICRMDCKHRKERRCGRDVIVIRKFNPCLMCEEEDG